MENKRVLKTQIWVIRLAQL